MDAGSYHGFATSEHDMSSALMFYHLGDDLIDRHLLPLWLPRCVRRITPLATQIAPRGADENRGHAGKFTLALDRIENLGDQHAEGFGGSGEVMR